MSYRRNKDLIFQAVPYDYQRMALNAAAIVAETDRRGRIIYVNQKFVDISQYSIEELIGQDHRLLNSGTHSKDFFTHLWRTISRGEVWQGEICNRAKDGSLYWVDSTIYPVKDEYGQVEKYIAIRFDVTDKKKALNELSIANENIKQANRVKTEFLANMSHEIRTPLNSIIGLADILMETPLSDEQRRHVETFRLAGRRLLLIVNDILDLARLEAGRKISIQERAFSFPQFIQEIDKIVRPAAEAKSLDLSFEIDPALPEVMSLDEFRLYQILMNLVGNAIKFSDKGRIRIQAFPVEKDAKILLGLSVEDSGIGISENLKKDLFNAFVQAETSASRTYAGTGLGLAISKHLVELMGGDIQVHSEVGKGSCFKFAVPFKKGSIDREKKEGSSYFYWPSGLKKILVVDDLKENRDLIQLYFKGFSLDLQFAANGQEAVDFVQQDKDIDLVLMDMHMPKMDGYAAVSSIRSIEASQMRNHPLVIVAVSASTLESDVDKMMRTGCDDFIAKPVLREALLAKIVESFLKVTKAKNAS